MVGAVDCGQNPIEVIHARYLPILMPDNFKPGALKRLSTIDWEGLTDSLYEYEQWIPKDTHIKHINMTPQQGRELRVLQMSWV